MYGLFELTEEQVLELTGMKTYIQWLLQLNDNGINIYTLPEKEIMYLVDYVKTNTGRGAVFANNILCGLYDICIDDDGGGEKARESERVNDGDINPHKSAQSVSPGFKNKTLENITFASNPTNGELRIKSEELRVESVEVFDVYGRALLTSSNFLTFTETSVDISHLQTGIYFVRIATEQGIVVKKVIKQ
jgi:hypothetical protein